MLDPIEDLANIATETECMDLGQGCNDCGSTLARVTEHVGLWG